ncbi:Calcium uptake protein, mitochondrial [Linum grandiflorum]
MFPRATLRKSSQLILLDFPGPRFFTNRRIFDHSPSEAFGGSISVSSPSASSSSSLIPCSQSCRNNGNEDHGLLRFLFRSVSSGVAVVGSSLGLGYWYSSEVDHSGFVSYAEGTAAITADESAWTTTTNISLSPSSSTKTERRFIFGDGFRRRVFFNYEKRIRLQSPPEKVFEYFASSRGPDGDVLMTPADLMRAIVPVFPSSESDRVRQGFLRGERFHGELHCSPSKFFMLFDTDNDGLISFPEYIFFVTLLSIPESSFHVAFKMFDHNNNGEIDIEEFKRVMGLMRSQSRQGARHRNGKRQGLKVTDPVEDGGLLEYFFGKDGSSYLQHDKFVQFLGELHNEILRLEFAHYDHNSTGTISAKDFALSLVASADVTHISKLLDRVEELTYDPSLRDVRITFDEFREFADLRKQLQQLTLAIFSYGRVNGILTKRDFQRASSQVCGISISDNLVDIIFHVFDADRSGTLSSDEFIRVLQSRQNHSLITREAGLKGLISCCMNCATTCSIAKAML